MHTHTLHACVHAYHSTDTFTIDLLRCSEGMSACTPISGALRIPIEQNYCRTCMHNVYAMLFNYIVTVRIWFANRSDTE